MSIDFSFSKPSDDLEYLQVSKPLSKYQATCLDLLLFEKDYYLRNKRNGFLTSAYKANQLFQSLIRAYSMEYHRLIGLESSNKKTLKKEQLSVGMAIKGSTAAAIFTQKPIVEQNDLDTVIYFDKLPHDSSFAANNAFYRKVAYQAISNLLELHYGGDSTRFNPEDFFENLILFSDNSVFLVSFANIDFAFPVPDVSRDRSKKASCTFLHESLKIKIPITNGKIKRKDRFEVGSEFDFDLETIKRVFLDRTIIIPQPEAILYNGFERLAYSVSKGWTILDKPSTYVLIDEFAKRTKESALTYRAGVLFSKICTFDRLMALITKKEVHPICSLKIFLNSYRLIEIYSEDFPDQGLALKMEFNKAFNDPKWKALFPPFIAEFLGEDALEQVICYITLKGHLANNFSENKIRMHLSQRVRVFGVEGKQIGFFVAEAKNLEGCIKIYQQLITNLKPDISSRIFSEFFFPFNGLPFTVENIFSILYFIRALHQEDFDEIEIEELKILFPKVLTLFADQPNLIKNFFRNDLLERFFSNHLSILEGTSAEKAFLIQILQSVDCFHLFPIIYLVLREKIVNLEEFLFTIKPSITSDFIRVYISLFAREENELTIFQNKLFIEAILKVFHDELPVELLYYSLLRYSQLIKKERFEIKNELFWVGLIERLLVIEKKGIEEVIDPFLSNKVFLCRFLSIVDLELYSLEKVIHFFSFAKEMNLYTELVKIVTFFPPLVSRLDASERMQMISSGVKVKEFKDSFLDDFLTLFAQENTILLQPRIQEIIEELSSDIILKMIIPIFLRRCLFSKLCLRTFLQSKILTEKLRSEKKEIRSLLLSAKDKQAFPTHLAAELIYLFLGDQTSTSITDSSIRFALFCVEYLNIDDEYEKSSFLFLIQTAYENISKLEKVSKSIYKKTLAIYSNDPKVFFPKDWLKKAYESVFTENKFDLSIFTSHKVREDRDILSIIEKKISIIPFPLHPDQIYSLLDLFDDFLAGLKTLLFHMEKFEIHAHYIEINNKIFSKLKDQSRFKFLKRTIEKNLVSHLVLEWIKLDDYQIVHYEDLLPFFIEHGSEEDKISLMQIMIKKNSYKEPFDNLIYSLFVNLQDSNKLPFYIIIGSLFDKLLLDHQIDLLVGLHFLENTDKISLIEKAAIDFSLLPFLAEILSKFPSVTFFGLQARVVHQFSSLIEKLIFSIISDSENEKPLRIEHKLIEIYLEKYKTSSNKSFLGCFDSILTNINCFKSILMNIEEILGYAYPQISLESLLKYFSIRFVSTKSIKIFHKATYEKLFEHLINQLPIFAALDFYSTFAPKMNLNEVSIENYIFKLVHKCADEAHLSLIPNIIKLERWKNFSRISDKEKKKLFSSFEKLVQNTHTTLELVEIFSVLKLIFPLIGSTARVEAFLSGFFTKFSQNILLIDDDRSLFQKIYLDTLHLKNKIPPSKGPLIALDKELHVQATKLLADLSVNLQMSELFEIIQVLSAQSKDFVEKYIERVISENPRFFLKFFQEKDLGQFNSFLTFFTDYEIIKKLKPEALEEISYILFQSLQSVYELASEVGGGIEALTLFSVLEIYCSIPKPRRIPIENKYIFDAFNLLFREKNVFLGGGCSVLFIAKQIGKLVEQQDPFIFFEDSAVYLNRIIIKMIQFIFLVNQGMSQIEIPTNATNQFFIIEEKKREEVIFIFNNLIFFLIENVLIPLKDTKMELYFLIFTMIKTVGSVNVCTDELKKFYVENMLILSANYLKKLSPMDSFEERGIFLDPDEPFDAFLKWDLKTVQDYTLFNIRRMIYSMIKNSLPIKIEHWLTFPSIIEKLYQLQLFQQLPDKINLIDMMKMAVLNVFSLVLAHDAYLKSQWKEIFSEVFIRFSLLLNDLKTDAHLKTPVYRALKGLLRDAQIKFQTSANFLLNQNEKLFAEIPLHDFIHVVNIMEFNDELSDENLDKQFDYFKIFYSMLVSLSKRKSEVLSIPLKDLIKILEVSSFFSKSFIQKVSIYDRMHGIETKIFITDIVESLAKLIPKKEFSEILLTYIEIGTRELSSAKPSVKFLKKFFLFLIDYKAYSESFNFFLKIKSPEQEVFLRQIPEFLILEDLIHKSSSDIPTSCTIS